MLTDFEVTYILRPSLDDTQVAEESNAIADAVRSNGGEVVGDIEKLGKRRLAYEIDNVREGHYVIMKFRTQPEQEKELERKVRLNDAVLRALFIRTDE